MIAPSRTTTICWHPTPLGAMKSVWTRRGLYSLCWDDTARRDVDSAGPMEAPAAHLQDCLDDYFATGAADFSSIDLDGDAWSSFRSEVYRCCRSVAAGTTVTYKQLAELAGSPSASRAVGAAMAENRVLLVIPCHRVVGSTGNLRGFSGPGGLAMKRFLLDMESR